jgi:hypothetical protein
MHRKQPHHSITSSARATWGRTLGGRLSPVIYDIFWNYFGVEAEGLWVRRVDCHTHPKKLFHTDCFSPRFDLGLLVQNHVQQGFMDFDFSVVFDKTQLAEFVHEKTHA